MRSLGVLHLTGFGFLPRQHQRLVLVIRSVVFPVKVHYSYQLVQTTALGWQNSQVVGQSVTSVDNSNIQLKIPVLVSLGGDSRLVKYERKGIDVPIKNGCTSRRSRCYTMTKKKRLLSLDVTVVAGAGIEPARPWALAYEASLIPTSDTPQYLKRWKWPKPSLQTYD